MKTVVVRYQVKPEAASQNEELIRQVFVQLERERPAGLRYQVFRLQDGLGFLHVASSRGDGPQPDPLTTLDAFRNFVANIKERCTEPPQTTLVQLIGTYDGLG